MKTAVIMTGQARSFKFVHPNQNWYVYRKLPNPTFFASLCDDADSESVRAIGEKYPLKFERIKDPVFTPPPNVHELMFSGYGFIGDDGGNLGSHGGVQGFFRQHWSLKRGWEFFQEQKGNEHYDLIVRIRPDLWFQEFIAPDYTKIGDKDCLTPWWSTFSGVNDRFAIMGNSAAKSYMTTYDKHQKLFDMGCPMHHETVIKASMELDDINVIQRMTTFFLRCRKDKNNGQIGFVPEQIWQNDLGMAILNSKNQ
jgi:hypothetical protein